MFNLFFLNIRRINTMQYFDVHIYVNLSFIMKVFKNEIELLLLFRLAFLKHIHISYENNLT